VVCGCIQGSNAGVGSFVPVAACRDLLRAAALRDERKAPVGSERGPCVAPLSGRMRVSGFVETPRIRGWERGGCDVVPGLRASSRPGRGHGRAGDGGARSAVRRPRSLRAAFLAAIWNADIGCCGSRLSRVFKTPRARQRGRGTRLAPGRYSKAPLSRSEHPRWTGARNRAPHADLSFGFLETI